MTDYKQLGVVIVCLDYSTLRAIGTTTTTCVPLCLALRVGVLRLHSSRQRPETSNHVGPNLGTFFAPYSG